MTGVEGQVVRPRLGYDSFAVFTQVPVATGGIATTGITFDGDLTPAEAEAVWWFITSRDDADQARRQGLSALRAAAVADPSLENVSALSAAVAAYLLGEVP